MKENAEKREFTQQLEQTAHELSEKTKSGKGKAFVLIGSDRIEGEDGDTQTAIAAGGTMGQIIEVLADFMAQDETAPLVSAAMEIAALKRIANRFTPNDK